jgi:hypothetical protein
MLFSDRAMRTRSPSHAWQGRALALAANAGRTSHGERIGIAVESC